MKRFLILSLLLFWVSVPFAQEQVMVGARPLGMGSAFVATSDDANSVLWNPAGMSFFRTREMTLMYSRLFWGIDRDNIGQGFLGYSHNLDKLGAFGISVVVFDSERFRNMRFGLGWSHKLFGSSPADGLSVGFTGKLFMDNYRTENFEADMSDPLLAKASKDVVAPSLDVGLIYRTHKGLSLGIFGRDLLEPDMSIESDGSSKVPMGIYGGGAYRFRDNITCELDIGMLLDPNRNTTELKYSLGAEYWLPGRQIAFRGGVKNIDEATVGMGYRMRKKLDLQMDYAMLFPLSDVGRAGATSHKISVVWRRPPPPKYFADLTVRDSDLSFSTEHSILDEKTLLSAKIENIGDKKAKGFFVSLFVSLNGGDFKMFGTPLRIKRLGPGESKELIWEWVPVEPGEYSFFVNVDDDGSSFPELVGTVDELDENNNTAKTSRVVLKRPEGKIEIEPNLLTLVKTTTVVEERPMVPVFFFPRHSDKVDARFEEMARVIRYRLKNNPDIRIRLRGYYNPLNDELYDYNSGKELAIRRAEAAKDFLTREYPDIAGRIEVVRDGYNFARFWASDSTGADKTTDQLLVDAENRRVEIEVVTPNLPEIKAGFIPGSSSIRGLEISGSDISRLQGFLNRNPELIVLCEGGLGKGEKGEHLAFTRAVALKDTLTKLIGEQYSERVFLGTADTVGNTPYGVIALVGEGLIYRPVEGGLVSTSTDVDNPFTDVYVECDAPAGVRRHRIEVRERGTDSVFTILREGDGPPPKVIRWDWANEDGNLIDPHKEYYLYTFLEDSLGQTTNFVSDSITTEIVEREKAVEELIIVQFNFDTAAATNRFQEARLEHIARKLISKATAPHREIMATVHGHTDTIGLTFRNNELSLMRAKVEEAKLREYLMYLLGFSSRGELSRWLWRHRVRLTYEGRRDSEPFVVNMWRNGKLEKVKLGNDLLPEGRAVNRRVMITIETVTEYRKQGEQQP
ncbi:MAG: hypothetical protein B6D65_02825 [candidate division Zixibacteria bacterium 4484_93]|nr:MAG: hypothetical protein B6D65_02825 [candidate division Zixibacteria bacterium 4484_93]